MGNTAEPGPVDRTSGWRPEDITVIEPAVMKRAVAAAAIGNITEWYDFGGYAYIASTIGKVFYPGSSHTVQLLAAFGTFAAAFIVRPLGGLILGPLGDRFGRTRVLAFTMILMAAGTFCIGIVPSYASIGIFAPLLLLLARLAQGFSSGGEYGGAMTFIAEYAPDRRRGFLGSWLEFGTLTGYVLGAGIVTLLSATLSEQQLLGWGWRIPFLIAGPLGVVGVYLRLKLEETPAFSRLAATRRPHTAHRALSELRCIFVRHWPLMLSCAGLVLVFNVTNYMLTSYMPTYLTDDLPSHGGRSMGDTASYLLQIAVMLVMMVAVTFVGRLTDRIGRRPVMLAGCAALVLLSIPSVMLIRAGSMAAVFFGLLIMGLTLVIFSGSMPSTLPAIFPTGIRQGGLSIAYNISVALFGGTVGTVMTALVGATGDLNWPAYYLIIAGVLGAIAVWFTPESARRSLPGSSPAVETQHEARELAGTAH
jgi:MFS transporter, MHS family, proline/betaine transporter